jgi:hypothetical protein
MPPVFAFIPLYYQLLQAYYPDPGTSFSPSIVVTPTPISSPTPTPTPAVLGVATEPLPAVGGDGQVITIAVFGDSMIETLNPNLPKLSASLQKYYPKIKFNLINFGYPATSIDNASPHLSEIIDQSPNIIIIESFAYNNFGNTQIGIDKQWQFLSTITSTIKEKLPQTKIVLAATIAPNSIVFGNGTKDLHLTSLEKIEKTKTIKLYLQNLVNFATSQNYPLADAYRPSLFQNDGLPDFINPTDHIHTSDYGAEFFSDTIAKTIHDNKLIEQN